MALSLSGSLVQVVPSFLEVLEARLCIRRRIVTLTDQPRGNILDGLDALDATLELGSESRVLLNESLNARQAVAIVVR
jgi:hypothetical protein